MNENILLINIHSSSNLGDAALLQTAIKQLQGSFSGCRITISMDDPASYQGEEKVVGSFVAWTHPKQPDGSVRWKYLRLVELVPACLLPILSNNYFGRAIYTLSPGKLKETLEAYRQADIVISGPGGFLYSSGRGISLLLTILSISMAIIARKPVYMFPQSIGPLKHPWERRLVRWMLDRVRIVMVREPISMRLIEEITTNLDHVKLIPDLAFSMPKSNRLIGEEWLKKNNICVDPKEPLMGMTIVNWGEQHSRFVHQKEYEDACAEAIHWFLETTGGKAILFPQVFGPYKSQDDRIPTQRVVYRIAEKSNSIVMVDSPLPIELLKSVYGWMDVFIGTRMHSNIFALSEGVPVIWIAYLPKTRGTAEMLGLEEWCLDITQVGSNKLTEMLKTLWETGHYWDEDHKMKYKELISQTDMAADMVNKDYLDWKRARE